MTTVVVVVWVWLDRAGSSMAWLWSALLLCFLACKAVGEEQQITLRYTIVEEMGSSSVIGNILNDAHLEDKYNHAQLKSLELAFLNPPAFPFQIDRFNGKIRTVEKIDRDEICAGLLECVQKLDVVVRPMIEIIKVIIQILDLNDNHPTFPETAYAYQILESAESGTNFVLSTAMDPDSGVFGVHRYELQPESEMFHLKVKDKVDGSKDVRLVLVGNLDRETRSSYHVRILAYDGGNPPKSGSTEVTISVLDANDNDPVFDQETYEVIVPENTPIDTTILKVHASDADSGSYGEVLYRFSEHTRITMGHIFGIVASSGEIYIRGVIDYEEARMYHLSVLAQDRGPDSVPTDTTAIVHVTDVNDHSPQIMVNTLGAGRGDTAEIMEASTPGTFVAHIKVTDADQGRNAQFTCGLSDSIFQLQQLNLGEFKIVTNGTLNREHHSVYVLTVICKDKGAEPQVSVKHIQVNVTDMNDNAPIFSQDLYTGYVTENSIVGAYISSVTAMDADIGVNAEIEYRLDYSAQDDFLINPKTGSITAQSVFDRERRRYVEFRVKAVDKGVPQMTGTTDVVIYITDVNDEHPIFTKPVYNFDVYENEPFLKEIGAVTAVDADEEPNNIFVYSLLPDDTGREIFMVDSRTGMVSAVVSLDREETPVYHVTVVATDTSISHMSSTAQITIHVRDRNDNDPVIEYPSASNNTIYVPNQVPVGYLITKIKARDPDSGPNANLTYELVVSDMDNMFLIDPLSGYVRVNHRFGPVDQQAFELQIKVRDQGVPVRFALADLIVLVNHSITYSYQTFGSDLDGNNFTIVITLGCVSVVIMMVLVVAIGLLWRQEQDRKGQQQSCRVEAIKAMQSSAEPCKDCEAMQNFSNNNRNQRSNGVPAGSCEHAAKDARFGYILSQAETHRTLSRGSSLGSTSASSPYMQVHQLSHKGKKDQDADSAYSAGSSRPESSQCEARENSPQRRFSHGYPGLCAQSGRSTGSLSNIQCLPPDHPERDSSQLCSSGAAQTHTLRRDKHRFSSSSSHLWRQQPNL